MEFRTKREAEEAIRTLEKRASDAELRASWARAEHKREHEENAARQWTAEAARIRALLPTLPE